MGGPVKPDRHERPRHRRAGQEQLASRDQKPDVEVGRRRRGRHHGGREHRRLRPSDGSSIPRTAAPARRAAGLPRRTCTACSRGCPRTGGRGSTRSSPYSGDDGLAMPINRGDRRRRGWRIRRRITAAMASARSHGAAGAGQPRRRAAVPNPVHDEARARRAIASTAEGRPVRSVRSGRRRGTRPGRPRPGWRSR